jgi:Fic family protein
MAFEPTLRLEVIEARLQDLEDLRREIESLAVPVPLDRWLRSQVEARGAHMSTYIEGNPMTEPEVRELFERPREVTDRAERENLDYRDAQRFVRAVANDFHADIDGGLLRGIHYLVVRTTYRAGDPAQYRIEQNRVADSTGRTVYLPPPPGEVSALMDDLVLWLRAQRRGLHPLLLAAVAHTEFVNIHPFADGNGRSARALTTYLLWRHGWGLRGFVSSEALFGRDREAYYRALATQGSHYHERQQDLTDWCEWFLRSMAIEAATASGIVRRWLNHLSSSELESAWAQQVRAGYMYLVLNREVSRSQYADAVGVSPATAVRQLNLLIGNMDGERVGAGRSTKYRLFDDLGAEFAHEAREEALTRFA